MKNVRATIDILKSLRVNKDNAKYNVMLEAMVYAVNTQRLSMIAERRLRESEDVLAVIKEYHNHWQNKGGTNHVSGAIHAANDYAKTYG